MTHIYTVIIIFVLYISSVDGQEKCPTGKPVLKSGCQATDPCTSDSKCYRMDDKRICCGALGTFCPTKMHTFNFMDDHDSYIWGPGGKVEKTKWYLVVLGGQSVACPIPFSYTYRSTNELSVLPVDYDESNQASSKPIACNVNSNCKKENDEFCGAATNPSFLGEVDKSGANGAPLRFCYKFQNFGSTKVKPVIKADEKELITCTQNVDCSKTHGSETFCFFKEDGGKSKEGFCAFEELGTTGGIWLYVLIGSIVCAVVFLVLSVCLFVAHRRSSSSNDEAASPTNTKTLSHIAEPSTSPNYI